jgi:Tfp pilus assembly protein PilF
VDQALADLNEAIRLAPDYVEAYRARAEAYTKKGDAARARADRAEADRLEKEDSHTER